MTDLTVTVIVPVYNGERYLAEALESVRAQDHRPIDLVVVDDGSDDGTGDVARGFPEARYLRRDHAGLAATRNAGVAAARGAFIAFLDADDLWPPHKLRVQVDHLVRHPEVDYVVAYLRNFLEPGHVAPGWLKPEQLEEDQVAFSTGTLLARREAFERIGDFNPVFAVGDDTDWFSRARQAGLVSGVLPEALLRRRIHDRNLTTELLAACRPSTFSILKAALDRRRAGAGGPA